MAYYPLLHNNRLNDIWNEWYKNSGYEIKWCCDPCSYECNFSICIEEPEKFRALTYFVKIAFITARIIASLDCPLIIITLNNNGAPLQKSLIFCFPWLNIITWYLERFSLFLLLLSIVYYFFFLISVHGKNIWNNLYKIILNCFWEEV